MISSALKRIAVVLFAAAALLPFGAMAQQSNTIRLDPPQPVDNDGKIEVLEFFAYGCIHCASLEPLLEEWKKKQAEDVKVVRVPHPSEIRGIDSRPLFYGLQALGQLERLHAKIFIAANNENVNFAVPSIRNKWLKANGVDPAKYEEVIKSFTVVNQIKRAERMVSDYKIEGTPMMAVNGRVSVNTIGGFPTMFATVDRLIAESRAMNAAAKPTAKPAKAPPAPPKAAAKSAPAKAAEK